MSNPPPRKRDISEVDVRRYEVLGDLYNIELMLGSTPHYERMGIEEPFKVLISALRTMLDMVEPGPDED